MSEVIKSKVIKCKTTHIITARFETFLNSKEDYSNGKKNENHGW